MEEVDGVTKVEQDMTEGAEKKIEEYRKSRQWWEEEEEEEVVLEEVRWKVRGDKKGEETKNRLFEDTQGDSKQDGGRKGRMCL